MIIDKEVPQATSLDGNSPVPSQALSPKSELSDGSFARSQYSSCLESEYDKYCSANSVMGTPSLCSSVGFFSDCLEYDRGSFRGLGTRERVDLIADQSAKSLNSFYVEDDITDLEPGNVCHEFNKWSLDEDDGKLSSTGYDMNDPNFRFKHEESMAKRLCELYESSPRYQHSDHDEPMYTINSVGDKCRHHEDIKGKHKIMIGDDPLSLGLKSMDGHHAQNDKLIARDEDEILEINILDEEHYGNKGAKPISSTIINKPKDHHRITKDGGLELNQVYDEVVYDMEEILLDSDKSFRPSVSLHSRDGGTTASTSELSHGSTGSQHPLRIINVEVVGVKKQSGNVSLSEKLVGVKEYTVYTIRVWRRENHWDVERRYLDFCMLYHQLKAFYSDKGRPLPAPWFCVECESRKIFGNTSADVVAQRSVLIQECLQSVILSGHSSSLPSFLVQFLSPKNVILNSDSPDPDVILNPLSAPSFSLPSIQREAMTSFGTNIGLIVDDQPNRSAVKILESQNYCCAGCWKHFPEGKMRIWELVEAFGLAGYRFCNYTSQLFCSSCHVKDCMILPARILHHWDFSKYPVSKMAKTFLDSIHDQPMLCVGAVNPMLFSKVPALHHVQEQRKKIVDMIPYVRCPFRRSIQKGLGSRRYIVESIDFFTLKDLIDLSKGAFAALPVMVEAIRKRITEHITEQCLVCCDVGIPCGARQACDEPASLIFPFQGDDVDKCVSCNTAFHKRCFSRLGRCPCAEAATGPCMEVDRDTVATLAFVGKKPGSESGSPLSFLAGLFSRGGRANRWGSAGSSNNVILMDSLPSMSI